MAIPGPEFAANATMNDNIDLLRASLPAHYARVDQRYAHTSGELCPEGRKLSVQRGCCGKSLALSKSVER